MNKIPIIVVAGPTASGKTGLAIDIAKRYNGEIVNADSMQIYKYMDIGTAKPTLAERAEVVHHLVDFVDPKEEFSVADYTHLAHKKIDDIIKRGKVAVVCGGTGLYISSLIDDVTFGEVKTDYAMREELEKLTGSKIFLDLWVRVKENWREREGLVSNFGYNKKDIEE